MTNNKLKIIAMITMIIDHFGYYFSGSINPIIYVICRIIGRIAMPIFTFLIIEGYIHTSNFKKYIIRLGIVGIITQLILYSIDLFAKVKSLYTADILNVVFAYIVLLLFIKVFELLLQNKKMVYKLLFTSYISGIFLMYKYIKFDYGIILIIFGFFLYLIRKNVKDIYLQKILLVLTIFLASLAFSIKSDVMIFAIFSIIPLIMYNGKIGNKSKIIKYLFYAIYPLQHLMLYGISILIK